MAFDVKLRVLRRMAAVGREPCSRNRFGRCIFSARVLPSSLDTFNLWWNLRERHSQGWRMLTLLDDTRRASVCEHLGIYLPRRALEALRQKDFGHPQTRESRERDERVQASIGGDSRRSCWLGRAASGSLHASGVSSPHCGAGRVARYGWSAPCRRTRKVCTGGFRHPVMAVIHPEHKPSSHALDQYWQYWVGSAMKWLGHAYLVRGLGHVGGRTRAEVGRPAGGPRGH